MDRELQLSRPSSPTETISVSPCEHCRKIFIQPDTYESLASEKGLQDRRRLFDMVLSASRKCFLCKELLYAELPDGDFNYDFTPVHRLNQNDRYFTVSDSGDRKVRTRNYTVVFRWKIAVTERRDGNNNAFYLAVYRNRWFKWKNIIDFQLSTLDGELHFLQESGTIQMSASEC
jgi:hypothetical protein